ncbi:MAG TPA: hypothetical protein VJ032_03740, partial [Thermoanaerobaculia bacterium]|nr:hypothetical protein [Thermoanaerobaculia bacterium]
MSEVFRIEPRNERRRKPRVVLRHGLVAHFGPPTVMVIDASETGARIEHFSPVNVGKKAPIRFEWDKGPIAAEASVLWSRVHWLADAERGTIFQSGLCFSEPVSGMHEMVTKLIARSAAQQIANARGISAAAQPAAQSRVERAFLRCALIANLRWEKRWTESSEQPT